MARYRKLDTRIWLDEKFTALSCHAKLAFVYMLTCPQMTMLGAMRNTSAGIAAELGIPSDSLPDVWREITATGAVKFDERACFVWLPNWFRYNRPENPSVVASWPTAFKLLPECALKRELFQHMASLVGELPPNYLASFAKAFSEPSDTVVPTVSGTVVDTVGASVGTTSVSSEQGAVEGFFGDSSVASGKESEEGVGKLGTVVEAEEKRKATPNPANKSGSQSPLRKQPQLQLQNTAVDPTARREELRAQLPVALQRQRTVGA